MRTHLVLLLGLAVPLMSPPVAGQMSEKQAAAALKAAVKVAVKEFKSDIKVDAAAVQLAIADFEGDIEQLDVSDAPATLLFAKLIEYQIAVRAAWADADGFVADVAAAAWGQLVAGGGDPAEVPGLTVGDGGALDQLRRLLRTAAEKSADKLRKRLNQAITKAAKGSTFNLRVRLDVPLPAPATAPYEGGVTIFSADELSIDVLVGTSRDGVADDGNMLAAGTAAPLLGNVTLGIEGQGVLPFPIIPSAGRWSVDIGGGAAFTEANMVVLVTQGGGGLSVAKAIGMP